MTLAEAITTDFQADVINTRKLIEAIPADKLDWKPHEKSMTLGQLAGHLAESPRWIKQMMADELDLEALEGDWKPFEPTDRASILTELEEGAEALVQALEGRDDPFLQGTWTIRRGERVLIQEPRHQAVRNILLTHAAHHRGQLTVYLRLLDVPVPATFGPSADDPGDY